MNLLRALTSSLMLPKKSALFKLNRIGMGTTLGYVFLLLVIVSIPSGIKNAASDSVQMENTPFMIFILQFVVFYLFVFILMGLVVISVLAFMSGGISKLLKRKLTYRQLWKMSAYAMTVPALFFAVAECFHINKWFFQIALVLLWMVLLMQMILIFPRRKRTPS